MKRINPDTGKEFQEDDPRPKKPFPDGFKYKKNNHGEGVGKDGLPLLFIMYWENAPKTKDGFFREKWGQAKERTCSFCGVTFLSGNTRLRCPKHRQERFHNNEEGIRRTNPDTGKHFLIDDPRPKKQSEDGKIYPQDGRLFSNYRNTQSLSDEIVAESWRTPTKKKCVKCGESFNTVSEKRKQCHKCYPTRATPTKQQVDEWLKKGEKPCASNKHIQSLTGCSGIIKLENHYGFSKSNRTGNQYCLPCRHEVSYRQDIKYKYGITPEEYDLVSIHQKYCCAICGVEKDKTGNDRLCVDHDKETGFVRGLICHQCNRGIGNLMHDPDNLIEASKYVVNDGLKKLAKKLKRRNK